MYAQTRGPNGIPISDLLKDGAKSFSGIDEAVLKNLEACKALSTITRTSLGPNGMNKLVVNHLDKVFLTSDAATILKEMEIVHPAAKLVGFGADMQEKEFGDSTNLVVVFAGELLINAEDLLRMGLHTSQIVAGYTKAGLKLQEILEGLVVFKADDMKNVDIARKAIRTALASKQYGYEDVLSDLVAKACLQICRSPKSFNVDNVRVAKVLGGSITDSLVIKGLCMTRGAEGTVKHVKNAKVAIFATALDASTTETKGTVLMKNAQDILDYNMGEEKAIEETIKQIASSGANVVVTGQSFGEMALHFMERHSLMAVKCPSKFELRRICKATGGTALARMGAPLPEEMGTCDSVSVEEIGGTTCVVFNNESSENAQVATILARSSTQNMLDDLERAVDDGVNVFKGALRDGRFVAGAGATEIEISRQLQAFGETHAGLDQYSIKKYAESLEVVPRTLAENAGLTASDVISSLYAAHETGKNSSGVDIESENEEGVLDATAQGILDHYAAKSWALRLATDAAVEVLRVDQIIMAKPAGGPKPPQQGPMDAD
eukprot:JP446069.1.p1 GENE.JP446069.1~~JP446069.1.p1  ORF type:complete len:556 (+),score=199.09 JP446069.1:22-1668(+)